MPSTHNRHKCRKHGLEKCNNLCQRGYMRTASGVGKVARHYCKSGSGYFRARTLTTDELYSEPRMSDRRT